MCEQSRFPEAIGERRGRESRQLPERLYPKSFECFWQVCERRTRP
jgi:hypothetical protein